MSAETILVIALALIFGVLGARLFKIIKIPQIVGYIIIGPPFVKLAVTKAGEIHRNITEEEMLEKYKVAGAMKTEQPAIYRQDILTKILEIFSASNLDDIPVMDNSDEICGIISLGKIKPVLNRNIPANLVIAEDIMLPVTHVTFPDKSLREAYGIMLTNNIESLPVVSEKNHKKILGIIEMDTIREIMREEIIKLREKSRIKQC